MAKSLIATLLFFISSNITAQSFNVEVSGYSKPIQCKKERSINGYFCQDKDKYLIIKKFGDEFNTVGNLLDTSKDEPFTLTKIVSPKGWLVYEDIHVSRFSSSGLGNLIPPQSLSNDYIDLFSKEMAIDPSSSFGDNMPEPSQQFRTFISSKLKEISNKKQEIRDTFKSKDLVAKLDDGSSLTCQQGETQSNSQGKLAVKEACQFFKCTSDSDKRERILLFNSNPDSPFARVLHPTSAGFINGPKLNTLVTQDSEKPLIDFTPPPGLPRSTHSFTSYNGYEFEEPEINDDSFVPNTLRDQSDFFKSWNPSLSKHALNHHRRVCSEDVMKSYTDALESFEEKVANAEVAHYITVTQDILSGYYLPLDQVPAGACNQNGTYYNPDSYQDALSVSPFTNKSSISLEKANELFSSATLMKDIAWDYKKDGCYARAHLMARRFEALGVKVDKAWLKGELRLEQDGQDDIEWNFHVAPVVYVENERGLTEKYVIDPSISDRPLPVKEWSDKITRPEQRPRETGFPFPQNSAMYKRNSLAFSNSDSYLPHEGSTVSEQEKIKMANETMTRYRGYTE